MHLQSCLALPCLAPRHGRLSWFLDILHRANARLGLPSSRLPHARPSSQSVTLITFAVLSQCWPSSVCSIVWLMMRPSSSNSNMNSPVNSSWARLEPATMLVIFSTTSLTCPFSLDFPHVSHLTMSFSLHKCAGVDVPPFLIIRSDNILSFTLPTTGTRPHATGAVHNAAVYAILPLTVGRCGCVEGKRWRLMCGERISCGSGDIRSVGRLSWRIRIASNNVLANHCAIVQLVVEAYYCPASSCAQRGAASPARQAPDRDMATS